MALHGDWKNNAEKDRWEAVIDGHLAVARFDRHARRYMAYIDSPDGRAPDHYAPESFSDPEAAKAWCEAEILRLAAERPSDEAVQRQISEHLRVPDPEL